MDEARLGENGKVRLEDCLFLLSGGLTHAHRFWQGCVSSLHGTDAKGQLENWQSRRLHIHTHILGLSTLVKFPVECKSNLWLHVCIFVHFWWSLSVSRMQPAVCWRLSCVDYTSCWQRACSEDASHNITAGRWEDITSKHTHTRMQWHSVKVISRSLFRLAIISDLSFHPH